MTWKIWKGLDIKFFLFWFSLGEKKSHLELCRCDIKNGSMNSKDGWMMERRWVGGWKAGRWRDEGWMDDGCLGGEVDEWCVARWVGGRTRVSVDEWMNKPEKECDLVIWSTKQPERSSQLHLGSSPPTQKSGAAFSLHSTELYKSRFWLHVWNGILYFLLLGISFPHSLKRGSIVLLAWFVDVTATPWILCHHPGLKLQGQDTVQGLLILHHVQDPLSPLSLSVWGLVGHCLSGVQLGPATQRPEAQWLITSFHRQKTHVS